MGPLVGRVLQGTGPREKVPGGRLTPSEGKGAPCSEADGEESVQICM